MPPKRPPTAINGPSKWTRSSKTPLARLTPYTKYFRDPDNVDELIRKVRSQTEPYGKDYFSQQDSGSGGAGKATKQPTCRFLQLSRGNDGPPHQFESNQPKVFLATLYLQDRLTFLIQGNEELHKVKLSRHGPLFRNFAADINKNEPMLKGVTPQALFGMFESVVEMHDELDKELECLTGNDWNSTHFSRAVEEISCMNKDILKAKECRKTDEEQKEKEVHERTVRVMHTLLQGKGARRHVQQQTKEAPSPREETPVTIDCSDSETIEEEISPELVTLLIPPSSTATLPNNSVIPVSRLDGPPRLSASRVTMSATPAVAQAAVMDRSTGTPTKIRRLEDRFNELVGRMESFRILALGAADSSQTANEISKEACNQLEAKLMDRMKKIEKNQEDIIRSLQEGLGRQEHDRHQLASKLHHVEISVLNLSYSLNYGNGAISSRDGRHLGGRQPLQSNQPIFSTATGNGFNNFVHHIP
ncbi:hypothetical protein MVEG_04326 [Podila verticillata NRRL 6337]|nr:hypothetical protein MVEG_04326 [Podila verticillata NRRL 6337]